MDETTKPEGRSLIIPAVSFRLPKPMTSEDFLSKVPTYVSNVVSDGMITSIDGRLNGQPFHATWPRRRICNS